MNIVNRPIDSITPYEDNPRRNDDAVEPVAKSIKEFGFQQPIVVDKDGVIIAGHTRWLAAKSLGLTEVPCVVADLTDKQAKAYRLADNKTGELAGWDFSKLELELADLTLDFDMSDFGFELFDDNTDTINAGTEYEPQTEQKGSLAEKYLVPPFSIIYGNKPNWIFRKRLWAKKGIRSDIGRGGATYFQCQERLADNR